MQGYTGGFCIEFLTCLISGDSHYWQSGRSPKHERAFRSHFVISVIWVGFLICMQYSIEELLIGRAADVRHFCNEKPYSFLCCRKALPLPTVQNAGLCFIYWPTCLPTDGGYDSNFSFWLSETTLCSSLLYKWSGHFWSRVCCFNFLFHIGVISLLLWLIFHSCNIQVLITNKNSFNIDLFDL